MDARQRLYVWLTGIFVASLLVADTVGCKLFFVPVFSFGEQHFFKHTAGQLSFPITFLLTDIVNEFYGPKAARRLTVVGLVTTSLAFVIYTIAVALPIAPESSVSQEAFAKVFGLNRQLIVASLSAYLVGQLLDITVFGFLKRMTRGRWVWLRATGSTLVSQAVDTAIVTTIFTWGMTTQDGTPFSLLFKVQLGVTGYVLKFLIALALTPAIYLARWLIRTRLGLQPLPVEG